MTDTTTRFPRKRWWAAAPLALLLFAVAAPAYAGLTTDSYVTVDPQSGVASGAIGSARAHSGSNEYIGCSVYFLPAQGNTVSQRYVACYATSSTGASLNCFLPVQNAVDMDVVNTLTDDSYVRFVRDSSARCSTFEVKNYSYYRPRQP